MNGKGLNAPLPPEDADAGVASAALAAVTEAASATISSKRA